MHLSAHLCFDAAAAVVSAPSSQECAAEVLRRPQRFVARDRACRDSLPWLGNLAGRGDCGSPAIGDCITALSGALDSVSCDTADVLICADPGQQFAQHGDNPNVAADDLDRPDLQRLRIDPEMDFELEAAF